MARVLRQVVPTLFLLSLAAFALTTAARGDPALIALQQDGQDPTPALLAEYRAKLGLDDPLPVRYVHWLSGVVHGDLGCSLLTNRPVAQMLGERIGPTLPASPHGADLLVVDRAGTRGSPRQLPWLTR